MDRGKGSVGKRGKSLFLEFSYKGERFRPSLRGLSPDKKAHWKTAQDKLAEIQVEIVKGTFNLARHFPDHPKAKRFRKGSDIKVCEKLDSWIERKRKTAETTTWRLYKSVIEHHLIPAFGHMSFADMKPGNIRDWMQSLSIDNKTINNALIPLRAIFSEAFEDGLIDENPLTRISNLKLKASDPNPFTRDEMEKILAACDGQVHNLFKFAFWTGLRSSELIALRWRSVNLETGKAHIRNARTRYGDKDRPKTDAGIRDLELLPPALDALKAQLRYTEGKEHVFHNPVTGKPWNNSDRVKRFWDRIIKRAGVEYRIPYTTRHTFASLMLSSGINPMWVARQMGHKDWGMIRKVYGRWIPDVDTGVKDKVLSVWQPICVDVPKSVLVDPVKVSADWQANGTDTVQVLDHIKLHTVSNPVTPTNFTSSLIQTILY